MRWLTADIVFDGFDFHTDYYLQVDDIGMIRQVVHEKPKHEVNKLKGLLMPGMVNAHCHLELSHYKGAIDQKRGLSNFLQDVNQLNQDQAEEDKIQQAIQKADADMQANGIVAVGDICNTSSTMTVKKASNIHYHNFIECIAIREKDVERRFREYQEVYNKFNEEFEVSLALHTPYTCHEEMYKRVNHHSDFISIHNQESEAENFLFQGEKGEFDNFYAHFGLNKGEIIKEDTNASSFMNSNRLLDSEKKKLFVHNTFSSKEDIAQLDDNSYWCFCPKANLYIEDKLPDIPLFLKHQDRIVLGTDSLASNDSLSILSEVKVIQDNFPKIPLHQILQWATSNGAKLFGLTRSDARREKGSFANGNFPGFVNVPDFDVKERKLINAEVVVV